MQENEKTRHHRKALRLTAVMDQTGMGRSFIYREMASKPPRFPRCAKIGRASVWDADEVDQWLATRLDRNPSL